MQTAVMSFTAVFLRYGQGYVGFVEELPGLNSEGRTLEEARENLRQITEIAFDEERRQCEALIEGKDVVREAFLLPVPPPAPAQRAASFE